MFIKRLKEKNYERKKVLFDPMIEIVYCDCMYDIKHLSIILTDGHYEEKFSNRKFKIDVEKFKKLLEHHWQSFKEYEKFARENKLGNECYVDAVLNYEHIFIPLYYYNKDLSEEVINSVEHFIKVLLNNFLTLCRSGEVTLEDVKFMLMDDIKQMAPNTEFSMRELFAKYKDYFWDLSDAVAVHKELIKAMREKIVANDKFGDKFIRVEPENYEFVFDDDFGNEREEFLENRRKEFEQRMKDLDKFINVVGETKK